MGSKKKAKWWHEGVQWECQSSGKCCGFRGQYGYVYLTPDDRKRMAKHFGLGTKEFTKDFCQKEGDHYFLKQERPEDECRFLNENQQCGVYLGRPTQCRTWPFWPENMSAKSWNKNVENFCPGVGKGRVWSKEEIQDQMKIQKSADA